MGHENRVYIHRRTKNERSEWRGGDGFCDTDEHVVKTLCSNKVFGLLLIIGALCRISDNKTPGHLEPVLPAPADCLGNLCNGYSFSHLPEDGIASGFYTKKYPPDRILPDCLKDFIVDAVDPDIR
jgi:hypothetical protein